MTSINSAQVIRNNSIYQYELKNFLKYLNNDIISLIPFENDPKKVATHVRLFTEINILTGKEVFKWNIEEEAKRLQVHNKRLIDSVTDIVWQSRITCSQKQRFESLSNGANDINQKMRQAVEDTRNSISQINVTQETDLILPDYFYNGTTKFNESSNMDSLILGYSKEY
ncbi:hypothetical protein RhiirA5_494887 [Rhizophagus irregularis]|uniref:Uncharacterized protein n=1 Tax=Rhizophagus irregularis TaxID=588596 RepID=A0A2N0Q7K2_9GLOM|nr:hypothetical protein RhiirA5_494887 [Rhizophagus irregularis]